MKKIQLKILTLCIILSTSCRQEENKNIAGNLRYTSSILAGSYLVMQDSVSGTIDTIHFRSSYNPYSLYFQFLNNYDSITKKKIWISFNAVAKSRSLAMYLTYSEKNKPEFISSYIGVYQEPFVIGETEEYYGSAVNNYAIATYSEYELKSKAYKTVFESKQIKYTPSTNDTTVFNFLYSMHTGIIKIRMSNKNELIVLELIDSKIIR